MKQTLFTVGLCMAVCGCSGLSIKSLNGNDVQDYFSTNQVNGYIVYEPIAVVEIANEPGCEIKDKDAKCIGEKRCKVGTPLYLPNYQRPYVVNSNTGFGKAGVDVSINNGWQLGTIKDSSDNSGVLTALINLLPVASTRSPATNTPPSTGCPSEGLYRLEFNPTTNQLEFTPLKKYQEKN